MTHTLPFRRLPLYLALLPLLHGTGALAADESAPTAAATALDTITILGAGQSRQVQELGGEDLAVLAPGSSPLKALELLPGVNFRSADAFGASEWTTKLNIRGFAQNQLGFTLDDVPLGDMSYRNHNGLGISRAIIGENIDRIVLSQGTGALETASSSNLGGTVQFYSLDPAQERRVTVEQSLGQHAARRSFARIDSGQLGPWRLALSVADQGSDKWKGGGEQKQQQFNAKAVGDFGAHRLSAFINYSERKEVDYQDLSKEMIGRLGWSFDNYYPDWSAALQSARGVWRQGETSIDDAYYAGSGIRKDWLGGITLDSALSDTVQWKNTVYHHRDKGPSLWWSPYLASSAAVPVTLRTVEYGINRSGLLSSLSVRAGAHTVRTGIWYEHNAFDQAMRFYAQGDNPSSPYDTPANPLQTRWDYRFTTKTLQFHLQDDFQVSDRLAVNAGFKSLSSDSSVTTRAGDAKTGSIKAEKGFLPQLGANFKLDARNELFAAAAQNMRAYKAAAMEDSPFASTQAGFDAVRGNLKPETSVTVEAGWRYHQPGLAASATVYHVDFKNRLLAIQQGSAIEGNPSVLANVGRVRSQGVEGALTLQPARDVNWFSSLSYNQSEYRDDFTDNGVRVAVRGKQVVDTPRLIAASRLSYDNGSLFGHVGVNHLGKRYYTYLNDNGVGAQTLWDASLGWRSKALGWASEYHVKLSVSNLFDRKYVASLGTNGFVTSDPGGTAQTLQVGAPRTAYVTFGARF
ncbi:TonB-dependent receptor [Xylophilus sp.]|uniref:TonB-dependent receptor n=1 Tax=Xylophilus sp. TaxID=2653893 RepID=UPI0013B5F724|nr:TonB-dependent receptor [Xylophilus sp.]KAF1046750.1 MAG: Ferrichrome outer membrane transporter/phage receptor [Xylophilus sp.]